MEYAREMLEHHPRAMHARTDAVADALMALAACADACTVCADACLSEPDVESLRRCIRLDLDCADVCTATSRVLARLSEGEPAVQRAQLEACVTACRACATECERHADHMEHCRVCAEACRACERACQEAMQSVRA